MRSRLCSLLAVSAAIGALSACAPKPPPLDQAKLDSGEVKGAVADGVVAFKGIPFAAPPVGDLRWRAPQPVAAWQGVRDATQYGHDCMQLPFPSDAAPLGTTPSEDCLVANVWRPADAKATKLPVLVWIYGGGWVNGGSSPPTYSGDVLAKQGIVFVSFNYRLARFGTFAHPQLTAANADDGLFGDYGYMDQVAALKWVQKNVAAFGGDPGNVTIVGESAGGGAVHTLVTSPLAKGLFQKAVVQSGGGRGALAGANDLKAAEAIGIAFAQEKGIAKDDPDALKKLRALSGEDVVDNTNLATLFAPPKSPPTFSSPIIDGKLAVDPETAYVSDQFAHVPMMIGATSDDIGGKTGTMVEGARYISGVISGKGVPVYEYRFSYVADSARTPQTKGAGHASDIPFFFHTEKVKYGDKTTAKDIQAGALPSAYLVNFVKTGDPNGGSLPRWEAFTKEGDQIMDFAEDATAKPGKDPWGADLDAAAAKLTPAKPRLEEIGPQSK